MEQSRQWEKVVLEEEEEEIHEVGLRKTKSQHHTATAAAASAAEFGGVRIEESVDMKEDGRGVINFGDDESDVGFDVTTKFTDIQKSLSTVINYQIGENIRDESLLLNLPTFDEKNHSDERLDVTAKITDIQKSPSDVINPQNGENIRDESLPLNLPTFGEKNPGDERLDVTAKITDIQKSPRDFINHQIGENIRAESLLLNLPTFGEKNHSDERLDVTAKITDIQKSLSTVINYQIGENIRDESLLLNLPTFGEKNHRDERLDVTTKITDIQKSLSTVINYRNGENIRDESLPLNLPTFDVKNPSDERLDVTAKITDIQKSRRDVINYRNGENIRDESLPLTLPTFDESYEDRITSFIPSDTEIIERASIDLIKKTYEETEFELGRLLEEPDSHNFYCPNCNACIEKIILLRREQERLLAAIKDLEPRARVETPYTCTSCYSFLVFIGNQLISIFTPRREEPKGSEMPHTKDSNVEALVLSQGLGIPLPDQSHQPPSNQNAALPVLPLDNGGLAHNTPAPKEVLEGSPLAINVREISENAIRNKTANGHTQYVEENGVATKDPLHGLNGSSLPTEVKVDIRGKEDNTMEVNNEDKNNSQGAAFHKESIIEIEENGKQEETFHEGYVDETKGKGLMEPGDSQNAQDVRGSETITIMETKHGKRWRILKGVVNVGLTKSTTSATIVPSPIEAIDKNNSQGAAFHKESIIEIEENGKQEETFHEGYVDETKGKGLMEPGDSQNAQDVRGSETITIMETKHGKRWRVLKGIVNVGSTKSSTSATIAPSPIEAIGSDEPIPSPATQVTPVLAAPEPTISEPEKKWDILKSIVYGGLIESITSLGIVTSAAGADATTLHILALALANLVGGLFVIGHNLMELRNDQSGDSTTTRTMNETDRYFRQLGERENFKLHATVVVLSFLLFGLVSPVTYGFSFLKSDDKDMKLLAVAAASLLCIALLAIGKAYTQKASSFFGYFKTVLSYVIAGFIASGISYVVGELIKKLLEKLGLFKSSSASTLFLPGTAMAKPGWESF